MTKRPKSSNPIITSSANSIGNLSAEADDEFLFACFVPHPAFEILSDFSSAKTIISGRTGSGKTAIIRKVAHDQRNAVQVELPELSMNYVANSDIIRFLLSLGLNLDLLFQTLWKHIFCIEFIRLRYHIKDSESSYGIFSRFVERFQRDDRKKRALGYLKEWEGKFWITMDENIKDFTKKVEDKITAEVGGEIEKFSARAGYERTLSSEKRSELVARVKKIINADQLSDLSRVLDLLAEAADDVGQKKFYILVDKLDDNWVDEAIRFNLIAALIESLKVFQKVRSLKIVVVIRTDVVERVAQTTRDLGFQREKFDDYFFRIKWTPKQLKELVNKRINFLYRRKYTKDNVTFEDIFTHKIANSDAFDYICERTLLRPRDVMSFVNLIFEKAEGSPEILPNHIRGAEPEFSRRRKQALIEEWQSSLPSLSTVLKSMSNRRSSFTVEDLTQSSTFGDAILEMSSLENADHDPLVKSSRSYLKSNSNEAILEVAQICIAQLYRIGVVGVKLTPADRFMYSHRDDPLISETNLELATKVSIVPMLHLALNNRH